jgi:DDE family transposase
MSKMNTILTVPWVLEYAERIAATRSDDLASPYSAVAAFPSDRRHERRAFTTGVETKLYPAHELEKLYFRRWNVELHFRQIKTNQR